MEPLSAHCSLKLFGGIGSPSDAREIMPPKPLLVPPGFSLKISIQLKVDLILLTLRLDVVTAQSDRVVHYTFCTEYDWGGHKKIIFIKCL